MFSSSPSSSAENLKSISKRRGTIFQNESQNSNISGGKVNIINIYSYLY